MKKIFMLLFLLTFAFSLENTTAFKSRDCSEIDNPEECYILGCEWITLYEEEGNDLIITEGCIDPSDDGEDDCFEESESYTPPPECVWDCEGICDWIYEVSPSDSPICEDPIGFCNWAMDTMLETDCSSDCIGNDATEIIEVLMLCESCIETQDPESEECEVFCYDDSHDHDEGCYEDGEWYCFGCELFANECEYYECTEDGWEGPFTLDNDACSDNDDCDPNLGCGQALTCCDGLLYPTTCCSANCDEPIGECDDYYEGCQSDNGDWYDIGHEMFISDCEYFECTENGWNGPFELNNDDCSDNNDWECSDLGYEDCEAVDYCEWISDSDNPNSWGSCVEVDNDNDGPQSVSWIVKELIILIQVKTHMKHVIG